MSIIMNTAAPADPGTMNTTTKVPAAAVMSMTTSRKIMTAPVAVVMTTAMRITTRKRLPSVRRLTLPERQFRKSI